MCYKAEEHTNIWSRDAQHLRHLNTLIDTIRWLAGYIHLKICKHKGLHVADKYYEHTAEKVINVKGTSGTWDASVITDQTILVNRPDIVPYDKIEKTCLLIDMAVPDDSNNDTKETEKLSKYKDQDYERS